jgi:predicted nucleic acid-binding protein
LSNKIKRVYWDSCNWIGLINDDEKNTEPLRYVYQQAKNKEIEILTSTFTLAEVYRLKCESGEKQLPEDKDKIFEEFIDQEFVVPVAVTREIGKYARRLLRRTDGLKRPQDAIHLASAAINNVDELHTFDGNHLLPLDQKIDRKDGKKLRICMPELPPADPQAVLVFEKETPATKGESVGDNKESENNEKAKEETKSIEGNQCSTDVKV